MADKKVSALTDGAPAETTDEIHIARDGSDYKLTVHDIGSTVTVGSETSGATTSGTIKEVLATVTLPTNALVDTSDFVGLEAEAGMLCADNSNDKTLTVLVGGISGATVLNRLDNNAGGNRVTLYGRIYKCFDGTRDYVGWAYTARATGVASHYVTQINNGDVTLASALDVVVTGITPTQAGDLTLTHFVVRLIRG